MISDNTEWNSILNVARELLSGFIFSDGILSEEDMRSQISKVVPIAERFKGKNSVLMEQVKDAVPGALYGVGTNLVFRGWYCPSPVLDITIGKTSRGRLRKDTPRSTEQDKIPYYRYLFDEKKRLICVCWCVNERTIKKEYLLYFPGYRLGITYDDKGQLSAFTIELWEKHKIKMILRCLFHFYYGTPEELIVERYYYRNDAIYKMMYDKLTRPDWQEHASHQSWQFRYRVEDGYYTGVATRKAGDKTEPADEDYWPIKIRRKVGDNVDDSMERI